MCLLCICINSRYAIPKIVEKNPYHKNEFPSDYRCDGSEPTLYNSQCGHLLNNWYQLVYQLPGAFPIAEAPSYLPTLFWRLRTALTVRLKCCLINLVTTFRRPNFSVTKNVWTAKFAPFCRQSEWHLLKKYQAKNLLAINNDYSYTWPLFNYVSKSCLKLIQEICPTCNMWKYWSGQKFDNLYLILTV
jgi:hypothetical protein